MSTAFFHHDDFEKHDMGAGHPESPERLRAIIAHLADLGLNETLDWVRPEEATRDQLRLVHPESYLHQLDMMAPTQGRVFTDPDTAMTPHTLRAARLAAGANVEAVDMVLSGQATNAFVAARPPGHHAERTRSMGFCFYNNIAIAARHALGFHGLQRIAIVDFDVHQGNGTVDAVQGDERILMCSSFQHPFYPHSHAGAVAENIVNVPISAGTTAADYREQVEQRWLTALNDFQPQLVLISAGFDAHQSDPLAELSLTVDDYRWLTSLLLRVAAEHAGNRLVATLEGGYDLEALAECAGAHIEQLSRVR
ncbi:acetoin utilization deacetylase AcuC-like enzyme [Tamilnaduibacter salinus]|uniref:Acetoin utilization deacetylase AcuC-like enzyme n=1 Tax=Tamilnaduibacter salinus TaxID=1484056 RepID=A0A2U1CVG7_9GAMM|nr:histone deacetylase family protein [Tamilnaduibacter salinus]PVY75493.1 acetoin utilization deacetylase AcuC-like enzyme [Tamilnaduibacter salinus]